MRKRREPRAIRPRNLLSRSCKKRQNVVVANEIVTQAQFEVVSKLGLLEDDSVDINLYTGLR